MSTAARGLDAETMDAIRVVVDFARQSKQRYEHTKEWTCLQGQSCMTIRVPTALLNRIRDLGELFGMDA